MLIIKGVDTLEFGLDIIDYKKEFKPFLIEFKELKEEGQSLGKELDITLNNLMLVVGLTGMRFYAYRLTCNDFIIAFAQKTTLENPPVRVKFKSGFIWSYGYIGAYDKFLEWYSCFPGEIEKSRISRLDICIDTDEVEFNEDDKNKFITRAKSKTTHFISDEHSTGRKFTGFTIGKGNPILARIYNKSEEIKIKGKEWFKAIWLENGWDGIKDIWRIEFQLRRKALKELGIDKVEDFRSNEDGLYRYLTDKWLSIDNDIWDTVKNSTEPNIEHLIRKKVIQGDIKRLINQTNGLLISIGAYSGTEKIDEVLRIIHKQANKNLSIKGKDFTSEVRKRRTKFLNSKGLKT